MQVDRAVVSRLRGRYGPVYAETMAECQNKRFAQRRAGLQVYERESSTCDRHDAQCHAQADARWKAFQERAWAEYQACEKQALSQIPPPPPVHWKPGDPAPVAPDGRRYIMSCSGKVLGLYKPGGAMEVELQSHPGNCIPLENWGPGGFGPGTGKSSEGRCWDNRAGMYRDYSGSLPSGCDPNR
jgi:hypothetical protein